jgi:hypothetical protein
MPLEEEESLYRMPDKTAFVESNLLAVSIVKKRRLEPFAENRAAKILNVLTHSVCI